MPRSHPLIGRWFHNFRPRHRRILEPLLRQRAEGFHLSDEDRQRILLRTGRQPEASLDLFLEQIRNGRRLFGPGD